MLALELKTAVAQRLAEAFDDPFAGRGRAGAAATCAANPSFVRLLAKARHWWKLLRGGEMGVTQLSVQEGVQSSWVTRVVRLAFLSPEVIDAALKGRLRADVDVGALLATGAIPVCWREQATTLLPVRMMR